MAQVIYASFGREPPNPVNQTARCNVCEPTFALIGTDLLYDTEGDARLTAQTPILRSAILDFMVPQIWTALWRGFRCTNNTCGNREACANQPTFLAIGSRTVLAPPPAGPLKWQIVVGLAREIRCVPGDPVPDETPEVPEVTVHEPPIFLAALDDLPVHLGGTPVSFPAEPAPTQRTRGKKGNKGKKSKKGK